MEELDLKDLISYFIKKIPIILVVSSVFLLLGAIYVLCFKTPLYKGDVTLILVKKDSYETSNGVTQNDITLNQKLVTTYSEIVKSRRVLNQVVDKLDLEYGYQDLANKVSVSGVEDTEIIKISVSDADSEVAAEIANMISKVFKNEVGDIYNLENVSIIDEAEVASSPYNFNIARDLILFFLVGFVGCCGVLFVIYYFDDSVKSSEDIERKLKVAVIGNVPLVGRK